MDLFLDIFSRVTLPVVLLMALGFVTQKRLAFDVETLSRLIIHVILPGALIHFLSSAQTPISAVGVSAWFTVAQFFALLAVGWAAATVVRLPRETRPLVALAAAFPNSGNYGIPVIELAFGPGLVIHQAVITSLHSVLIVSVGAFLLSPGGTGWVSSLRSAFRTPLIPAVILGLAIRAAEVDLPLPVARPLEILAGAFTPMALFALGAQLAAGRGSVVTAPANLALALRLLVAPVLTWAAVVLLAVPGEIGDILVVGACAPVGVLLAIFAAAYRADARLASAMVFTSTVLSPIFITLAVLFVRA